MKYGITLIFEARTEDIFPPSKTYKECFELAGQHLIDSLSAWGVLIYSNKSTAIVLQRRNFPKLFK